MTKQILAFLFCFLTKSSTHTNTMHACTGATPSQLKSQPSVRKLFVVYRFNWFRYRIAENKSDLNSVSSLHPPLVPASL